MRADFWDRVGEITDRSPSLADLRHHRLQLLAASRMKARGEAVPEELRAEERRQAAAFVAAPVLLKRIRGLHGGRMVLMKGLEAGARWSTPRHRPFHDLDLLVEDAPSVHAALLADGFVAAEPLELYTDLHHLAPLVLPGFPSVVEIHSRPHWPDGVSAPVADEIIAAAAPSATGIAGILAPSREHHTVLLAAHAWAHEPLSRISALIDFTTMGDGLDVSALADAWGVARVVEATRDASHRLFTAPHSPERSPVWLRHLAESRERTVLEEHVTRVVGPATAFGVRASGRSVRRTLGRRTGEGWGAKTARTAQAMRHASAPRSERFVATGEPTTRESS